MESKPIECWKCSSCGIIHLIKEDADKCCLCPICHAFIRRSYCKPCFNQRHQENEKKLIEKAKTISYSEYKHEALYDELNAKYYMSLEEVEDEDKYPEFLWACEPVELIIDANNILEGALNDHHDDARDEISNEEIDHLQNFLDDWCKRQGVTSWTPDFSTRVELPSKESSPTQDSGENSQ